MNNHFFIFFLTIEFQVYHSYGNLSQSIVLRCRFGKSTRSRLCSDPILYTCRSISTRFSWASIRIPIASACRFPPKLPNLPRKTLNVPTTTLSLSPSTPTPNACALQSLLRLRLHTSVGRSRPLFFIRMMTLWMRSWSLFLAGKRSILWW